MASLLLLQLLAQLPEWSRQSVREQLETIDHLDQQIDDCEQKREAMLEASAERDLLQTLPGVGRILSAVIALEIGDISRFEGPENPRFGYTTTDLSGG